MKTGKCLAEITGERLDRPMCKSHLAKKCHTLWNVPITDLTVDDLRLLIGQKIGLEHLVPVALEILEENPLVEGDFYRGDLLNAVVRVDADFWSNNTELHTRLVELKFLIKEIINTLTNDIMPILKEYDYKAKI